MPLLTQTEFAEKCGVSLAYLSVNKSRNKVILDTQGYVDELNSTNQLFLQKCLSRSKSASKAIEATEKGSKSHITQQAPSGNQSKNTENEEFSRQNTIVTDRALKKMDIDYEKKQKEIERLDQEMRLARLQEEKLLGKLIPTDMVKNLFAQHFKSVTLTFKQAADLIAVEFGKKAKIARNDQAELRGQLVTIINRAIEDGITESKRSLAHIVHEYSQTRK